MQLELTVCCYLTDAWQGAEGVTCTTHAYGTNLEGEWDDVMAALKSCHNLMHEMGVDRTHMTLKLGTRLDKPGYDMAHKLKRITEVAGGLSNVQVKNGTARDRKLLQS